MPDQLRAWASARGYRVQWGPLEAAQLATRDVLDRRAAGEIAEDFFDQNLGWLVPSAPAPALGDRILVVVMPRPAHRVAFELAQRRLDVIIPPTYVRYTALFEEVARDLQDHALPPGSRIGRINAPLKSLAARLGLVRFGRNNLTYDPKLGTSIQLFGYVTDALLPVPAGWRPFAPELLPECEWCSACRDACPTGAIGGDRVILRGERCLTWWNEKPGSWPAWLSTNVHHCLVGCLACQESCPANPPMPVVDTGVAFSAEETRAILEREPDEVDPVWQRVRSKLDRVGRLNEEPVIGRNLRALLAAGA
jgi:epoxyqueuosine reductase